jgi:phage terminase large subunit
MLPEGVLERSDVIAGLDLGFRDPTAFCVVLFDFKEEMFYIVDEYLEAETSTSQQAAEIQRLMDEWSIEIIYIDSANQQQRYDFAYNYDIPTDNANKNQLDGIGYIGSLIQQGKLKILSSCPHVLYAFDQYRWDPNPNLVREKPIHDKSCHMADAIRYGVFSYMGATFTE